MKNMLIAGLMLALAAAQFAACQNTSKATNTDPSAMYACPMHPDITGKAGDKCSKCGMALEVTNASVPSASTNTPPVAPVKNEMASKGPLSAVYTSYFNLKNALTKDDGKAAQAAAKTLFDDIAAVPMDKLEPDQHTVWMQYQKKLSLDAEKIKSVDGNKRQREHFASLSKNMHEVMKAVKYDAPVYYQHCPMYNDGKGADWLSLDSKISNPYYGKEMLSCGKTIETIQ